ncbi:hypothetical protein ACFZBU_39450 [Embleya sp. NPDC008237]|uniref:hypothetical protein n=1 Tax=Embleya sp. NPDC008237 TaxID=3363978 RepID=UPI0036ECFCCC
MVRRHEPLPRPRRPPPRTPGREHSSDAVDPHPTGAAVERPSVLAPSEADLRTVATIDADDVDTIDHKAIDAALERLLKTHFPALRDRVIELEEALGAWDDEAHERWIARQEAETAMRSIDFRNGAAMEFEPAREMVAHWVGAARAMLDDAANYTQTPVELTVKVAESPEQYAFILQRVAPGALTPHQAREAAETERDAALAEIERCGSPWHTRQPGQRTR